MIALDFQTVAQIVAGRGLNTLLEGLALARFELDRSTLFWRPEFHDAVCSLVFDSFGYCRAAAAFTDHFPSAAVRIAPA